MILLIDNYDSFTYNLAQLLEQTHEVKVHRNDDSIVFQVAEQADAIVLSPGPGTPKETGYVPQIIQQFYQEKPILGICLGHQTIGAAFGSNVIQAKNIRHGKQSTITIDSTSRLLKNIPQKTLVMRYHSLVLQEQELSTAFTITARADDDQEIMAIEHRSYPLFGLQFHPESIGTQNGAAMLQNFIELMEEYYDETPI
ncbi:aminodeoxychorismate/anthranilate synthase component II [Erwinia sp. CPCC 100877]|nr:aminodeoxychorismate/anthranilate synthase component II [Erwinia sp. CPCC 100877]